MSEYPSIISEDEYEREMQELREKLELRRGKLKKVLAFLILIVVVPMISRGLLGH